MSDDRLEAFEAQRAEGIRDTIKFIRERNPGMTWEQAEEEMRRRVDAELANLSNSIGTCGAELTIADVQRAMREVGERQREYVDEMRVKADEAYLRLRMEPPGPIEPRYSLKVTPASVTFSGLLPTHEPTYTLTYDLTPAQVKRVARNAQKYRNEIVNLSWEHPLRPALHWWRRGVARRIRMARKRRRGYA